MNDQNRLPAENPILKHHLSSFLNRGLYCIALTVAVMFIGTLGMHVIEGFSYIDSFYFTCMIATGQGPPPLISPATELGKLFTCFLAFIAVGAMIASLGFLFGPFLGRLWKIGIVKFEEELEVLRSHNHKNDK